MKSAKIILLLAAVAALIVALLGVRNDYNAQFSTAKWRKTNGLPEDSKFAVTHFPEREAILDDLLKKHVMKGKTYRQIYQLLGQYDERIVDTAAQQWMIRYQVLIDYEWNIDPQHTMDLVIVFPLKNGHCAPDARAANSYVDDYRAE